MGFPIGSPRRAELILAVVPPVRVLAVALDASGKWGALYDGLAQHFEIVGSVRPRVGQATRVAAATRNWRNSLRARRLDTGWSWRVFDSMTRNLDADLAARPGDYDVIVQCQTLSAPGDRARTRPYVLYTDSTHALNQRHRFGGDPTPGRPGVLLQDRERHVAQEAAHVFTMSRFARDSMVGDYGVDPQRVTVVGAGTNLRVVDEDVVPERPRAILVGVELERKGGHEVLAAWPEVRAAVPDAELVIVGPPPEPRRGSDGVRWLGRVRSPEALSRLYLSSTVFVCPTLWDPWGLVFHEAMTHGLPCIGTDLFAVPEIIDAGETGLLVPPRDPQAVAEALIALLSDRERAAAMGSEARRRTLADATWSAVAGRMAPVIDAVGGAALSHHSR